MRTSLNTDQIASPQANSVYPVVNAVRGKEKTPMVEKILVIDDEEATLRIVAFLLESKGYQVIKAIRAEDGLRKAYNTHPDLVLLDVMMPDMDGWEVCRRLRAMSDVPIIFLTAKADPKEAVRGLDLGADDYIYKPFDNEELVARVRAHLRRIPTAQTHEEIVFNNGDFRINFITRELQVRGQPVHLTPKEFDLLGVLVRGAGRVITRGELAREAWGPGFGDSIDSLKLYIHYLRQKVEVDPQRPEYILTSRGVGYRFATQ